VACIAIAPKTPDAPESVVKRGALSSTQFQSPYLWLEVSVDDPVEVTPGHHVEHLAHHLGSVPSPSTGCPSCTAKRGQKGVSLQEHSYRHPGKHCNAPFVLPSLVFMLLPFSFPERRRKGKSLLTC